MCQIMRFKAISRKDGKEHGPMLSYEKHVIVSCRRCITDIKLCDAIEINNYKKVGLICVFCDSLLNDIHWKKIFDRYESKNKLLLFNKSSNKKYQLLIHYDEFRCQAWDQFRPQKKSSDVAVVTCRICRRRLKGKVMMPV